MGMGSNQFKGLYKHIHIQYENVQVFSINSKWNNACEIYCYITFLSLRGERMLLKSAVFNWSWHAI